MMKKEKIELSNIIGYDVSILRFQCFNPMWETLYYDYLENKNIELQYHKKNLMDYLSAQQNSLLNIETNKEYFKRVNKKNKLNFIKKCLYKGIAPVAIVASLIAIDDYEIHGITNAYNSYEIIRDFTNDYNEDGINEISTETLDSIDNYHKPTDDKFYAITNPLYNLLDETKISDNISFMIAMNALNKDMIEIEGVKYSSTGYITDIHYVYNHKRYVVSTSRKFKTFEQVKKYLEELYGEEIVSNYIITGYNEGPAKTLDEIPVFIKNQKNGKVRLEQSNNNTTKVLKRVLDLK